MTSSNRSALTRCSALAIVAALAAASCGGSDGDAGADSEAETGAEAADTDASGEPDAEPANDGASSAVLVLDGVEHVFDDFAQCLTFEGFAVMSVVARNAAGEKLQLSYEEPDSFDDDGEDAQYSNTIQFEPADGNSDWRSGSVVGGFTEEYGALDWSLADSTITGAGEFRNTFDPNSPTVSGSIDASCAE